MVVINREQFIDKGAGFPVLFAHGTRFDATMFLPQITHLGNKPFRCMSMNSRALSAPSAPHSLSDLVSDTLRFIDKFELSKVVLVGMSVGAFMALQFALEHERRLAGLVLISGHAGAFEPTDRTLWRKAFTPLDVDGMMSLEMAQAGADYCFGETTFRNNPGLPARWVKHWQRSIPARSVWHQLNSWIDKPCVLSRLGTLSVPTLVVHGLEDRVLNVEDAREMATGLRNARFVAVADAGHTVNLEAEDAVNAELLSFLNELNLPGQNGDELITE